MAILDLDLVGPYGIDQGLEWRVSLYHPGNVTRAPMRGEIRRSPGEESLASFRFEQARFDASIDRTVIQMILSPSQTRALDPTNGSFYVYDILITPPRRLPRVLLAGKVFVNAVVTRL